MRAVILAGGRSRRMGHDKAETLIGSYRMIDHVYARIKPQCNNVLISGLTNYGLNLDVIEDDPDGPKGPVGGLYTIWKALSQSGDGGEGFFTVPVDGPNFPLNLCERLYGPKSAIASAPDGTHQTFAWWVLDDLRRAFEGVNFSLSLSLNSVANTCQARHVFWPDESLFYNINTANDLTSYLTNNITQDRG